LPEKKNPHANHRKRVRQEFLENGFNRSTPDHKIMEMLLFYSIPRIDTNEIAHNLVNHFGSVSKILDASPSELEKVDGIGENSAVLIKLVSEICKIYQADKIKPRMQFNSIDEFANILIKLHFNFTHEVFSVTSFDSKGCLIATDFITKGDVTSVNVTSRMVIENLIERKAVTAVICHNHPSGIAMPSAEDLEMTARVAKAMSHIGIPLLDHIIVVSDDFVSLRQSAQYIHLFNTHEQ